MVLSLFWISKYKEQMKNMLPVCTENGAQILLVLFNLNTSLVYNSPFYNGVYAQFRIFLSLTQNLKNFRKLFRKMLTHKNLQTIGFLSFETGHLSPSENVKRFQRRNSELFCFIQGISKLFNQKNKTKKSCEQKFCQPKALLKIMNKFNNYFCFKDLVPGTINSK